MTPPRPLRNSPAIRDIVADRLMPDVMRWIDDDPISLEEARQAIYDAIYVSAVNGYRIAKRVEESHCGFQPDFELVEILDQTRDFRDEAYDAQVRAWVAENQIKPALKIRDHVDITLSNPRGTYHGIIVAFKSDVAQYAVSIPDLGQTFDHETRDGQYYIVDYEVLEAEQAEALRERRQHRQDMEF